MCTVKVQCRRFKSAECGDALANFFGIRHADTDVANHSTSPRTRQPSPCKARVVLYLAIGMSMMCRCRIDGVSMYVDGMSSMSMPTSMQRNSMYDIVTVALTHA